MNKIRKGQLWVLIVFTCVGIFFSYFAVVKAQAIPRISQEALIRISTTTEASLGIDAMLWEKVQYEQNEAILKELRENNKLLNYIARNI